MRTTIMASRCVSLICCQRLDWLIRPNSTPPVEMLPGHINSDIIPCALALSSPMIQSLDINPAAHSEVQLWCPWGTVRKTYLELIKVLVSSRELAEGKFHPIAAIRGSGYLFMYHVSICLNCPNRNISSMANHGLPNHFQRSPRMW